MGPLSRYGSVFNIAVFGGLVAILLTTNQRRLEWFEIVGISLGGLVLIAAVFIAWRLSPDAED